MKPRRDLCCIRGHLVTGHNAMPIGDHYACRKCHNLGRKEYYERNAERLKEYQRNYERQKREARRP